jgi:ubiquinone/menaquinone biosynthesis C-methylase UbiE
MKKYINSFMNIFKKEDKYLAEINYWKISIQRWIDWYDGIIPVHCGKPSPSHDQKVQYGFSKKDNAILTQLNVHAKPKYLSDLILDKEAFKNSKLLDIGSGPFPCAMVFEDTELYCLDPLYSKYIEIGIPFHYYNKVKFINAFAEKMPFPNNYFDAVISVNAIDHVDDFNLVAEEVKRIIKPGGKLRMHIHYHKKTPTEPIELNDEIVSNAYSWDPNFTKIYESKSKDGYTIKSEDETYALWSNFDKRILK